jgi:hypothetical protein
MYPRDRRRWVAVFCKLANVSVSLLISGPRMGKNHSRSILGGPDMMVRLLSSEKSFTREHHGSALNLSRSFWLNLASGRRVAPLRTFFTTCGEVRSLAVLGSPPGHSATVSGTPLRCAAFRRSPATVALVSEPCPDTRRNRKIKLGASDHELAGHAPVNHSPRSGPRFPFAPFLL